MYIVYTQINIALARQMRWDEGSRPRRQLADLSNALAEKEASDAVRREQHQATKTKARPRF